MSWVKKGIAAILAPELRKIEGLYQRHAGESCYIFGHGLSIKWMDLKHFKDRPIIATNYMMYHKQIDELQVLYSTIIEPGWFWSWVLRRKLGKIDILRRKTHKNYRKIIKKYKKTLFFIHFSNFLVTWFRNAQYISRWVRPQSGDSNLFQDRQDAYDGTLKFQLALATFMGFETITLVGYDYTHAPAKAHHFFEKGRGVEVSLDQGAMKDYIDCAGRYARIETVTLFGGSPVAHAVTYEELTGEKPKFRENHEIVLDEGLKSLAVFPGYKIY